MQGPPGVVPILPRLLGLAAARIPRGVPTLLPAPSPFAHFAVLACELGSSLVACWARTSCLVCVGVSVLLALLAYFACFILLLAGLKYPRVRLGAEPRFCRCCVGVVVTRRPSS